MTAFVVSACPLGKVLYTPRHNSFSLLFMPSRRSSGSMAWLPMLILGLLIGGAAVWYYKMPVSVVTQTSTTASGQTMPKYAVAKMDAPVLHTSDWTKVFGGGTGGLLKEDEDGLIGEMEFIALPGTAFTIKGMESHGGHTYYNVSTGDVPDLDPADGLSYWVDGAFLAFSDTKPAERVRIKPEAETVKANLMKGVGAAYVWGGNHLAGLPELLTMYPAPANVNLAQDMKDQWTLHGVDCSGFLYEATGGYTPRNTSELVTFGTGLKIKDLTADQIKAQLKPLDLITWRGHLMIVLDNNKTIESRFDYDLDGSGADGGVRIRDLDYVLKETLDRRVAVNEYSDEVPADKKKFVIRRWY